MERQLVIPLIWTPGRNYKAPREMVVHTPFHSGYLICYEAVEALWPHVKDPLELVISDTPGEHRIKVFHTTPDKVDLSLEDVNKLPGHMRLLNAITMERTGVTIYCLLDYYLQQYQNEDNSVYIEVR